MPTLDQVWGSTQADSEFERNEPPAGHIGVARLSGTRAGKSKKGELYFAIDLEDGNYGWGIYKGLTRNGQPHEGSVKSAKILLRQLGVEDQVTSPAALPQVLKALEGRYFAYEVKESDTISQVTGAPFLNTEITGPANAPTQVNDVQSAEATPGEAQPPHPAGDDAPW